MFKDIFFKHAAQVRGPCEKIMGSRILKVDSVHLTKVHVFHNKEDDPDPGRNGQGHSWIRIL